MRWRFLHRHFLIKVATCYGTLYIPTITTPLQTNASHIPSTIMPPHISAGVIMSPFEGDDSNHSTVTAELRKKTRVKFSTVAIREYNRIVGDHPDCKVGPPMSISWEFAELPVQGVDEFESNHKRRRNIRLTSITRKNMLHHVFGIPESEIRLAEKEVQKILKQRDNSVKQTKVEERAEAFLQSAKRKLRRAFSKNSLWDGIIQGQKNMFQMVA